ncbi:MAG: glycosyltransferase family 4 protein [Alphaproteobacteria bacterium]|nr:glycosyltransferase family 4 protein [Alphaproteobacteria bacterium]MCW5743438.1 glycosyltransferase family 4 protein [Alphaproteobacteria bacterium]
MTASAAIYYRAEEFDPYKRMMGRQVASDAFLRALARHDPSTELSVYAARQEDVDSFRKLVEAEAPAVGERAYRLIRHGDAQGLARAGCLFRPDPVLHDEAWTRRFGDARAYSLSGVTHTLSSVGAQRALAQYITAPYEEWDAVICTSHAVRRVVERIVEENAAYLSERFGATIPANARLQLPVIPLGVHPDAFDTTTPAMREARVRRRREIGAGDDDIVALFVGRLAFHAKANPLPMYQALEAAAKRTGRSVHLVQAGWFGSDFIERGFREGAAIFCPSVRCHFLDGRDPEVRAEIWAVGDLFTSLVDNIQETFGLAPIEAMAAGLPVVVADWDGYRETVREGIDGFLVPTTMTPPGFGGVMAYRHFGGLDSYDSYVGAAALNVAVDAAKAEDAYVSLIGNADLRRRMGEAGRRRAQETFGWSRIYGLYRALWGELAERRAMAPAAARAGNPLHPDPFRLFGHYPTYVFGARSRVRAVSEDAETWRRTLASPLLSGGRGHFLPAAETERLRTAVATTPGASVGELLETVERGRRDSAIRTLALLAKAGLILIDDRVAVPDRPEPLG